MTKIKNLLALALMLAVIPAHAGVKKIGSVNGVDLYRVKTLGIFVPSTTTIIEANTNTPGVIKVLNDASGPSVYGQTTTAAGNVGASYVRRPDTTKVQQAGGGANANANNANVNAPTSTTTTTVNPGPTTINNGGSHNHHNGN